MNLPLISILTETKAAFFNRNMITKGLSEEIPLRLALTSILWSNKVPILDGRSVELLKHQTRWFAVFTPAVCVSCSCFKDWLNLSINLTPPSGLYQDYLYQESFCCMDSVQWWIVAVKTWQTKVCHSIATALSHIYVSSTLTRCACSCSDLKYFLTLKRKLRFWNLVCDVLVNWPSWKVVGDCKALTAEICLRVLNICYPHKDMA